MKKKTEDILAKALFILLLILLFLFILYIPPLYGQDIKKKKNVSATLQIDEDSISITQIHQLQNILMVLKERYGINATLNLIPDDDYKRSIDFYNYKYEIESKKLEIKREPIIGSFYIQKKKKYWCINDSIRNVFLKEINGR